MRDYIGMTQSLLFVGCGDGLSDPNFRPFLSWLREVNFSNEARHYRLALAGEVVELQKLHQPEERIFVLAYGADHAALPGCLRNLSSPEAPVITGSTTGSDTGVAEAQPPSPTLSPAIIEYLRRLEAATAKLQLIGLGQGVRLNCPSSRHTSHSTSS